MKALFPILAAIGLLCAALPAAPKAAPPNAPAHTRRPNLCDLPDTISITECADKAQTIAEQQLNTTFQSALKSAGQNGENEQDGRNQQEKLRNVQRLWLAYREAECHEESDANSTLRQAFFASCVTGLDKLRTTELKDVYLR